MNQMRMVKPNYSCERYFFCSGCKLVEIVSVFTHMITHSHSGMLIVLRCLSLEEAEEYVKDANSQTRKL